MTRRKPFERLISESGRGEGDRGEGGRPRRSLGVRQLTTISVGATLGTGIFVVLGESVPNAGPAVILSFSVAGLTALFRIRDAPLPAGPAEPSAATAAEE